MTKPTVSIIFRALNEEKWFAQALDACREQHAADFDVEMILVDSGSTDRTMEIAEAYGCRIIHIKKSDFTFGRSLNYGCDAANGDHLVFISAHCIPASKVWLKNLLAPLQDGRADYTYGRQIGHTNSRFSEHQIFAKYFGSENEIPQVGIFANNANSAIRRDLWENYRFDETVTGLEDMVLAKALSKDGYRIGYVAEAPVIHIHEESFQQTKRRYYREALTLREILPEVQLGFFDFVRYYTASLVHDLAAARRSKLFFHKAGEIIAFRFMQYWGAYRGHNEHRILSRAQKERYYYPATKKKMREASEPETVPPHLRIGKRRSL